MVVKLSDRHLSIALQFEYGVILNGSQTSDDAMASEEPFEYGVILNGSQTTAPDGSTAL